MLIRNKVLRVQVCDYFCLVSDWALEKKLRWMKAFFVRKYQRMHQLGSLLLCLCDVSVSSANRRFPEITGEDNLTVFSYSGRVKSPEWRWQRRRADLQHFEIFRHGPIIIYTRLPAGETHYPICTFPASRECAIGISDAFSAFCIRVSVIFPTYSLYPQQKRAYSALHPQAWTCIYRSMPEGSYRVQSPGFPKIVY